MGKYSIHGSYGMVLPTSWTIEHLNWLMGRVFQHVNRVQPPVQVPGSTEESTIDVP